MDIVTWFGPWMFFPLEKNFRNKFKCNIRKSLLRVNFCYESVVYAAYSWRNVGILMAVLRFLRPKFSSSTVVIMWFYIQLSLWAKIEEAWIPIYGSKVIQGKKNYKWKSSPFSISIFCFQTRPIFMSPWFLLFLANFKELSKVSPPTKKKQERAWDTSMASMFLKLSIFIINWKINP